ncbi:response regulator [Xylophilus ampelinus]|uniref:Response regulator receiver domain-containing protein n=1 Tax=Xylophilus ampelinus TaxID=54067 RepID=A0A318SGT6_9BURK|nr:response regulator [Xylophilus ampelinus]MCS4510538.1 response regulator [Xylophilus ampelinus]PYE77835.1 response regulator receiver domain-containing protein [Xylophilus ampelinus]
MKPRCRAFLVEDNPRSLESLIPALAELACAEVVGFVQREDDALEWLGQHAAEVDVVVLDMFLLQGTGLGVLNAMRERGIDCTVVGLTNHATDDTRARFSAAGADAVFDKMEQTEDFFAFLDTVVRRTRTNEAAVDGH